MKSKRSLRWLLQVEVCIGTVMPSVKWIGCEGDISRPPKMPLSRVWWSLGGRGGACASGKQRALSGAASLWQPCKV
jgi:hypothetical protein